MSPTLDELDAVHLSSVCGICMEIQSGSLRISHFYLNYACRDVGVLFHSKCPFVGDSPFNSLGTAIIWLGKIRNKAS